MRVAVWDLGSSSFHLLVSEVTDGPGGERMITPVLRRRSLLNLGVSVGAVGSIPPPRVGAAVRAVRHLREQQEKARPDVVVAVATAALRDAANGAEVVGELETEVGVPIRVLDGQEEARLCFLGQRAGVWLPEGPALGVDLGGGSMELAVGGRQEVTATASVPIGATRLHGELGVEERLTRAQCDEIAERTRLALVPLRSELGLSGACDPGRSLLSGGSGRALARLAANRARRDPRASSTAVNQVELSLDQIEALRDLLVGTTLAERLAMPGMSSRRAPVLPVGATILASAGRTLGVQRFVVSEWGLREGSVLDALP